MSGWSDLARLDLVCRPIGTWPGTPTPDGARETSRFDSTLGSTVALLARELEQVDATGIVLQVDLRPGQIRTDGLPRADAKAAGPGVMLGFESRHGPLRYACDRFVTNAWRSALGGDWQHNLRAIALGLEALRKVERYGIAQRGEQYRGYAELPAGTPMPATHMTADQARELLCDVGGLEPIDGDPDSLARAYRFAARRAHPDAGGDAATFARVQAARDLLDREHARG